MAGLLAVLSKHCIVRRAVLVLVLGSELRIDIVNVWWLVVLVHTHDWVAVGSLDEALHCASRLRNGTPDCLIFLKVILYASIRLL